jgi:sugar phosphate isomerase/epimerase
MITRRRFLGSAAAGVMLGGVAPARDGRVASLPIGVQLYTVDAELKQDFEGTLRKVAAIGYRDVELPSFYGRSARDLRRALQSAGLSCASAHVAQQPWDAGVAGLATDLEGVVRYAHELGLRYVVCPMPWLLHSASMPVIDPKVPGAFAKALFADATREDWLKFADFLNRTGARLRRADLRLAYHNHNIEFREYAGQRAYDLLLEHTDPALVDFEMDAGWIVAGGADPVVYLKRHARRFRMMHVKDVKATQQANTDMQIEGTEAGKGRIDWRAVLTQAAAGGVKHLYVELDPPYAIEALQSIRISRDYLNSLAL